MRRKDWVECNNIRRFRNDPSSSNSSDIHIAQENSSKYYVFKFLVDVRILNVSNIEILCHNS